MSDVLALLFIAWLIYNRANKLIKFIRDERDRQKRASERDH